MATTTKCAVCGKETHFTRMSMITYEDLCITCREIEDRRGTMQFPVEIMREMAGNEADSYEKVEETVVDTSRWNVHYEAIFKALETGKYYRTYFQRGATEYQDERPFEYEEGNIECEEVVKQDVVKQEWVRV